tara:strand:+ start:43425 stop:44051 length:627 start_codon:yes stop_codon:yes gene_type:complete
VRKSLVSKYKIGDLIEKLTARQQLFVIYFLETANGRKAAEAAGYSKKSAENQGQLLLKNKKVADVIGELQRRMLEDSLLTAEKVMEQLSFLILRDPIDLIDDDGFIHTDISKMPKRIRSCIDSVEQTTTVDKDGTPVVTCRVKMAPKTPAVDMGLRVFKKYEDKSNDAQIKAIDWDSFWKAKAAGDPIEIKLLEADKKPPRKKRGKKK